MFIPPRALSPFFPFRPFPQHSTCSASRITVKNSSKRFFLNHNKLLDRGNSSRYWFNLSHLFSNLPLNFWHCLDSGSSWTHWSIENVIIYVSCYLFALTALWHIRNNLGSSIYYFFPSFSTEIGWIPAAALLPMMWPFWVSENKVSPGSLHLHSIFSD